MITVLIVDDQPLVRRGVRAFLEAHPDIEVVGEAASGEEAVQQVKELIPDVVLMDLVMPGMDGVEATRRIRNLSPRTQVIILTSFYDDVHIFPAIRAGALSYVLKDVQPETLIETVRSAVHGEAVLDPRVATRIIQEMQGSNGSDPNPFAELTDRELEILKLIAKGLDNAEIADQLCLSEKTVKGYVSNILSKLHLKNRTQVAIYAWQKGLVRRE